MPERAQRPLHSRPACLLGAGLGFLSVLSSSSLAAPFGKGPLDHSLCCGIRTPIDGGEFGRDPLAGWTPGTLTSGDSAMLPRHARPAPAAIRATPTITPTPPAASITATAPAPAAPKPAAPIMRLPGPSLAALDGPLETVGGYAKIAFSQLAGFPFNAPLQAITPGQTPPDVLAQVPAAIKRLDGKKVVLTGFMLPTKMENGLAKEFFFLSSSQLCCYGVTPNVNTWE